MLAKIITIGDEILIGQITDTNSAWIAARLNDAGMHVAVMESVADDAAEIVRAIDTGLASCDVVIVTGGLGPTKDDITKHTLAQYFGCGMREDRATYEMNERMLSARGIEYNGLNRSQAMVPECCQVLVNRNGTAPGMWFERGGKIVVSLPGVPFEMKPIVEESVIPRLKEKFGLGTVTHRTMITFGLAESMLAEKIAPWEEALPRGLKLAYLPGPSGIRLRLSAYDADPLETERLIVEKFAELEDIIPGYFIGYGEATVESATAGILTAQGLTLSTAESCTGGNIARMFTAMPGSSDYFLGGVVAYSYDLKNKALGVDADYLGRHGAVNRTVAEQMAEGARRLTGSDWSIATTGVAGPSQGGEAEPVGTVWIAVAHSGGVVSRRMTFGHLRQQNIERASAAAVNMLRLMLLGRAGTKTSEGIL